MCKYVYLDEHGTLATTNKVCLEVRVFACVFKHFFFWNTHTVQKVCLCRIYWQPGFLVPLDHEWRRLQNCVSYSIYVLVCVCIVCEHVCVRFRSMSIHRPASQQLS